MHVIVCTRTLLPSSWSYHVTTSEPHCQCTHALGNAATPSQRARLVAVLRLASVACWCVCGHLLPLLRPHSDGALAGYCSSMALSKRKLAASVSSRSQSRKASMQRLRSKPRPSNRPIAACSSSVRCTGTAPGGKPAHGVPAVSLLHVITLILCLPCQVHWHSTCGSVAPERAS